MPDGAPRRMTTDEFLAWAAEQPSGRYELLCGRVVPMAPERNRHAEAKFAAALALRAAILDAGLPLTVWPDGPTVRIDETTAYEPDALVTGAAVDPDAVEIPEPALVVEVISPSSRSIDAGAKLEGYFRLPSVASYLVIDPDRRVVVHHVRRDGERIETEILREGAALAALGLSLPVAALLPPPRG